MKRTGGEDEDMMDVMMMGGHLLLLHGLWKITLIPLHAFFRIEGERCFAKDKMHDGAYAT